MHVRDHAEPRFGPPSLQVEPAAQAGRRLPAANAQLVSVPLIRASRLQLLERSMVKMPKRWRARIESSHVLEVRGIPAETEEEARESALEAQYDDFNVHHIEDVVQSVQVEEEEA